jgi:hypothetical protein
LTACSTQASRLLCAALDASEESAASLTFCRGFFNERRRPFQTSCSIDQFEMRFSRAPKLRILRPA